MSSTTEQADRWLTEEIPTDELAQRQGVVQTFKFSTDPELEAKVRDVVRLYLNPPENAIVLSLAG